MTAAAIATNNVYHSKTKHIEIDLDFVKDKVARNEVKIIYIPHNDQMADALTKPLIYSKFSYFRNKLESSTQTFEFERGC